MDERQYAINIYSVFAEDLTSTQKLIMLYILINAGNKDYVEITNTELINVFKIDSSTLLRALQALEGAGYIYREVFRKDGRMHRIIHIPYEGSEDKVRVGIL